MPKRILSRVAIVDDHALLAQSLCIMLNASEFFAVTMNHTSPDLVERIGDGTWDIALLDLALGDDRTGGLTLARQLSKSNVAIVMVTGSVDTLVHAACLEAGAVGVLSKIDPLDRLVDAVKRVSRGVAIISEEDREKALRRLAEGRAQRRPDDPSPFARLTDKEGAVLKMLADGHAAGRIARDMDISIFTVRTHIRAILSKLGAHTQLEAVTMALRYEVDSKGS
jgi:DNA-binding NarL/FixJ family response regulator